MLQQLTINGSGEREQRLIAYCDVASRVLQFSVSESAVMRQMILSAAQPHADLATSWGLLRDLRVRVGTTTSQFGQATRVASLVEAAIALDDEIEFGPFADAPIALILGHPDLHENPMVRLILPLLRRATKAEVCKLTARLPVFPRAVRELIREYRNDAASAASLSRIARQDAVLAGTLLDEASTIRYAADRPRTDLTQAVVCMGVTRAFEVMLAAALRPLMMTSALPGLWQHSLDAARTAAQLASLTGVMAIEEAYLLGLVHDVGRLLFEMCSESARGTRDFLVTGNVPLVVAEVLTFGISHAEAGAEVLRHWRLPENFVDGVLQHHEPEFARCKESALLYIVEFWTDASEDLPSNARFQTALETLGLTREELFEHLIEDSASLCRT